MLGLLPLYWIGKKYSTLAKKHGRKPVGPVIGGIAIYYIFLFITSFIFGLVNYTQVQDTNLTLMDAVISIPVGLLATFLFYKFLKKKYNKLNLGEDNILDEAVIIEEQKP